jgi:hypothetical protein
MASAARESVFKIIFAVFQRKSLGRQVDVCLLGVHDRGRSAV